MAAKLFSVYLLAVAGLEVVRAGTLANTDRPASLAQLTAYREHSSFNPQSAWREAMQCKPRERCHWTPGYERRALATGSADAARVRPISFFPHFSLRLKETFQELHGCSEQWHRSGRRCSQQHRGVRICPKRDGGSLHCGRSQGKRQKGQGKTQGQRCKSGQRDGG